MSEAANSAHVYRIEDGKFRVTFIAMSKSGGHFLSESETSPAGTLTTGSRMGTCTRQQISRLCLIPLRSKLSRTCRSSVELSCELISGGGSLDARTQSRLRAGI